MKFVKNPISFFEKIKMLNSRLYDYIDNQDKEDSGILLFKTPSVIKNIDGKSENYIRSICCSKSPSEETGNFENETILFYFDLCQFSLDNEKYIDYKFVSECKEIADIFSKDTTVNEYNLYVRDITATFYTLITPKNRPYFEYIKQLEITDIVNEEDEYGEPTKTILYYHCLSDAFYTLGEKYSISTKPEEISTVTYANIKADEKGKIFWNLKPLEFDDIVQDGDLFFMDLSKHYSDICKTIEKMQNQYIDCFSFNDKSINIFGKNIVIKYNANMLPAAAFTCPLENVLNKLIPSNEIFRLIVEKTIAKHNMFNLEDFAYGFKEAAEKYWQYFGLALNHYIDIYKLCPKTELVYAVMERMKELNCFEQQVIGVERVLNDPSFLCDMLPSLKYVESFISLIQEATQKAEEYKKDMDDFDNGPEIIGGGFGISGALKGIFAATAFSAVAHTAYSAYKASKFDSARYNAAVEEFMVSKESKLFFAELIKNDFLYLILKSHSVTYSSFIYWNSITDKSCIDYEEVFNSFEKAYRLYSIALAKHLKLKFLPLYEGYEEYYDKDPKKIMEEVLVLFPYYFTYYEKYIKFGGKMSEDLKEYALAHMVDIQKLYEEEKTREEEIERKREEKAKKDAEKKKIEKEKIEEKKEALRKELESLSEIYGDLPNKYPDIFKMLLNNPIFNDNKENVVADHLQIAENIVAYLSKTYTGNKITNLFTGASEKFKNKKENVKLVHGSDKITDNNVVLLFDITVFGSAKDGFVITTDNICVRNSFEQPFSVKIKDIKTITSNNKFIVINGKYNINVEVSCVNTADFLNVFSYCICNLLYLDKIGYKIKETQSKINSSPVTQNKSIPIVNKQQVKEMFSGSLGSLFNKVSNTFVAPTTKNSTWKCSCGKELTTENKFCPNCGKQQPETAQKWTCPSCGNSNAADANFCTQCGYKHDK